MPSFPHASERVLEVSPDRARIATEAFALRALHTQHSPAVLANDEELGALLLEAIEPVTPLVDSRSYPSIEPIARLLSALHTPAPRDHSFPTVDKRVEYLFESSSKLYMWQPGLATRVPRGLYERGRRLARSLAHEDSSGVLLHGDLTPSNILDGGPVRGLVAIDPAPCIGDPAFDAVDLVLWLAADLGTIESRIASLAVLAKIDVERIRAWCVAFASMTALELASPSRQPVL